MKETIAVLVCVLFALAEAANTNMFSVKFPESPGDNVKEEEHVWLSLKNADVLCRSVLQSALRQA